MLRKIFDSSEEYKEEFFQEYLEKNKEILQAALGTVFYAYNYVLPKFQLGSNGGIPDFIVVSGQSNSFVVNIVELKLPYEMRFKKSGEFSKVVNDAICQVSRYKCWIDNNLDYFKKTLCDSIKKIDNEFNDSFAYNRRFNVQMNIIIGRRSDLDKYENNRNAEEGIRPKIISYDRLVDCEEKLIYMQDNNIPFRNFRSVD